MFFGYLYLYYDRIYMRARERYYRNKLKRLRNRGYTVVTNKDDDDPPVYH